MKKGMIRILQKLMLTCEQATYLIVKEEEQKLSFSKKLRLWTHLAICKFCRAFKIQSRLLNKYLHEMQDACAAPGTQASFDPSAKQELETMIRRQTGPSSEKK